MSGRKKHKTANEYLQYLKGDLSNQERHLFERDLESDPFEKEALEGMEMLSPEEAEADILSLHSRLRKRREKKRRIAWYSAAASIASLLIIGTIFLQIYNINPEVAEKSFNEEEFYPDRPAEPESTLSEDTQSEDTPTEETLTKEALPKEAIVEQTITKNALPGDRISNDEVSEKETLEPEHKTKGALQFSEGPPGEPETITHVEADAATDVEVEPVAEETFAEESVAEEKVAKETVAEERSGRGARRRSDRVVKPAAIQPSSMEKKAYAKEDSTRTIAAGYVGMETQEVQVEDDMNIDLVMQPDALTLNEVVVVDQGIQTTGVRSAQPSGGFKSFRQYVEENMKMPDVEIRSEKEIVILRFKVSHSGEITDFISLRSPGEPFTQEAIRLVKEGPSWIPATDDTGKIEEIVRLKIVFKN